MIWTLIRKRTDLIEVEDYKNHKNDLAAESNHRCVYCCINEEAYGGIRNFHIEHYRPKSKFKSLTNVYSNLFYSCSICNCFKSNDWPNEPSANYNKAFYPNPSEVDLSDILDIDFATGLVSGKTFTSIFIINKLFLNRPQLILERRKIGEYKRFETLLEKLKNKTSYFRKSIISGDQKALELSFKLADVRDEISKLLINNNIRPYTEKQIRRNDK